MKRMFLILVVGLITASTSYALGPNVLLVPEEDPWTWDRCVTGLVPYQVEIWFYTVPSSWWPSQHICVEFRIGYPPNVTPGALTINPLVSVWDGDLETGVMACFPDCVNSIVWYFHQTIWVNDPTPAWVEIRKHLDPGIPCIQTRRCDPGNTPTCAIYYCKVGINMEPPQCWGAISTEESSWGAIKSMYSD
ncbi:MAG: hypothetical protein JSU64_03705 [candidate division WOR-3 bacterium]|nr:MAG: hypothetical protein JSU64_03705 [candidate division WOR-3 bacterium]